MISGIVCTVRVRECVVSVGGVYIVRGEGVCDEEWRSVW